MTRRMSDLVSNQIQFSPLHTCSANKTLEIAPTPLTLLAGGDLAATKAGPMTTAGDLINIIGKRMPNTNIVLIAQKHGLTQHPLAMIAIPLDSNMSSPQPMRLQPRLHHLHGMHGPPNGATRIIKVSAEQPAIDGHRSLRLLLRPLLDKNAFTTALHNYSYQTHKPG